MVDGLYSTPSISDCVPKDMFYLQNLPSIVVSHVLNPQAGDTVLDMCAAPGKSNGHTSLIFCNCQGRLLFIDRVYLINACRHSIVNCGYLCRF